MMTITEVNKLLKQRPPFQMIDRIVEYEKGKRAKGIKCVGANEPYFVGHFPDSPIMPGVMTVESCAQLCSVCIDIQTENTLDVVLKINDFTFFHAIIPGDVMEIEVEKKRGGGVLSTFECTVKVGGEVFAKGTLTFAVASKESIYNR